jgi:hypothetical protein
MKTLKIMKNQKKLTSNQRWNNFIAILTIGTAIICVSSGIALLYINN